ncbi:MAG: hypothetical protein EHM61_07745 [Acidobacteria bacterium]|nr:MAG: hypothetical protein EHM61_07745 [Acidobacteriota bacterium]
MKKTILLSLVVLNLVCAVSSGGYTTGAVAVDVPFAFVAGGKTLPPGHYVIEKMSAGGQGVLVIRNSQGAVILTALCTSNGVGVSTPRIEFIKSGANYVLAVVKTRETASHVARASETARKL